MDKVTCRVCNQEFDDEGCLHKHIKAHKILLTEYYQTYWPRYDKFDGKIIRFRNKKQYLITDFNSRENLRRWVEKTDINIVRAYLKTALEQRIARKNLIWTPSQVELRTVMLPPIQCFNSLFGSYFALCEELGLKGRFPHDGFFQSGFGRVIRVPPPYTIFVDTREQKPLEFEEHDSVRQTLKFADYACSEREATGNCYIERKSAYDFAGTFSGGVERFCREMDRAGEAEAYIVVLVEDTLTHCLDPSRQPAMHAAGRKANPDFIFHNVRDIIQKYPFVQFLFVNGRREASRMVEKIFDSACTYKDVDLQYCYDTGQLGVI